MTVRNLLILLALLSPLAAAPARAADEVIPYARILVSQPGVYRVSFDELFGTEPEGYEAPTAALGLRREGQPVPIWVEDGGDGRLGPGDWVEFVGDSPHGELGYFHEYSVFNVYQLSLRDPDILRMVSTPVQPVRAAEEQASLAVVDRLEEDRLLLRFASRDSEPHEVWHWARLSQIDPEPFRQELSLGSLDRHSSLPVSVRVSLRGWSKPRFQRGERPADHRIEVLLNGVEMASGEWNQQEELVVDLDLPIDVLAPSGNQLELRVPKRFPAGSEDPIIDVVALNWIEVSYPRLPVVGERQVRFEAAAVGEGRSVALVGEAGEGLLVYGEDGARVRIPPPGELAPEAATEPRAAHPVAPGGIAIPEGLAPGAGYTFFAVATDRLAEVDAVELDKPSFLASPENRADYIIITHPKLRWALRPLIELHRDRGLTVKVVEIQDVYDEFNHGMLHPRAIRDFLSHAYHEWARPAPRFVLLAGDASWDVRNLVVVEENYAASTFLPRLGTHYRSTGGRPYDAGTLLNDRNLIPTWSYPTPQGQAAGDNWFVDFDGEDEAPEMAIGRLPVADYWDAAHIAEKSVRYVESREVGPWRRRTLWISDGATFQDKVTDEVASEASLLGFTTDVIKPNRNDPSNDGHRERLHQAFNQGQLLVHFIGHGGRFIWRTAPADFEKNRDLFTLEDLDQLEPNERLPIVLAMTCYSAPFDHPGSDSIGEKLLRLADKGAVAVVASSWRSTPNAAMSQALLRELARPGTVGEAFMRAKRAAGSRHFNELYNLLGDPALPIRLPDLEVSLAAVAGARPGVAARLANGTLTGEALVEWLGADGEILAEGSLAVDGTTFEASYAGSEADLGSVRSVRVYVWSAEAGRDGFAVMPIAGPIAAAGVNPTGPEPGRAVLGAGRPAPSSGEAREEQN